MVFSPEEKKARHREAVLRYKKKYPERNAARTLQYYHNNKDRINAKRREARRRKKEAEKREPAEPVRPAEPAEPVRPAEHE